MRKNIRLFVIAIITVMLAMTGVVEARKGETSSSSSTSKSSTSSSPSRTTTVSKSSDRSRSSKTNSSFADAAKTKQTKVAWKDYVKKRDEKQPDVSTKPTVLPQENNTQDLERQLAAIEKQIADARRQQQMIAVAQTAAQIAFNNRSVTPNSRLDPRNPVVSTSNTKPVNTAVEKPVKSDSGGTSWFTIFLIIGGIVVVIIWLRKSSSPTTIYRL